MAIRLPSRVAALPRVAVLLLVAALLLITTSPAGTMGTAGSTHPGTSETATGAQNGAGAPYSPASHGVRVSRRIALAVQAPAEVGLDQTYRVRAVAKVTRKVRRRPIRFAVRDAGRWRLVAKGRTNRRGRATLRVTSGDQTGRHVFRVTLPRHRGLAGASKRVTVRVVALTEEPADPSLPTDPTALGDPTDWSWISDAPGRWNPCATITWTYDESNGGYDGALADVLEAFDRIEARTGLDFEYAGTRDAVPFTDDPHPVGSDFHVGWASEADVPELAGGVVGLGGPKGWVARQDPLTYRWDHGALVLDSAEVLRPGYDVTGNPTWGQVILHEVLHALGLGHARGQEQLMHGMVSSVNHRFGAGDLTGMYRIGAAQGCL